MKRVPIFAVLLVVVPATALFYLVIHAVSHTWFSIGLRPDVRDALSRSLEDQKKLRSLDRTNSEAYRRRFEANQKLVNRIDVLTMSRDAMRRRIEIILVAIFAVTLVIAVIVWWMRQRAAEERERREYADRLSAYQQAARRHAHEIRTPLAAARLEVDRLLTLVGSGATPEDVERASGSVFEELDRLASFTREFTSFATIGQPVLREEPLDRVVAEFCETFANGWKNLSLQCPVPSEPPVLVRLDRDLFRQVLANLCANSSRATPEQGTVTFTIERDSTEVILDVTDTGGGIPGSIRPRIFDPYVTTSPIGEGMGLGLAISRKILLDHGGDLTLAETSGEGTTFRITLPTYTGVRPPVEVLLFFI